MLPAPTVMISDLRQQMLATVRELACCDLSSDGPEAELDSITATLTRAGHADLVPAYGCSSRMT